MKTTYYIKDKTACHTGSYIDEDGKNVNLQENAEPFPTRSAAEARAKELDPEGDWAVIVEETEETVTLTNPWSKSTVHKPVSEIIKNGLDAYLWPENVRESLCGMCDTDEEWVIEACKMMGSDLAGEIIIGS